MRDAGEVDRQAPITCKHTRYSRRRSRGRASKVRSTGRSPPQGRGTSRSACRVMTPPPSCKRGTGIKSILSSRADTIISSKLNRRTRMGTEPPHLYWTVFLSGQISIDSLIYIFWDERTCSVFHQHYLLGSHTRMLGTHLGTQTKKGQRNEPLTCTFMVAGAGFEPTTSGL